MKTIKLLMMLCVFTVLSAVNTGFAQTLNGTNNAYDFNTEGYRIGDAEFNDIIGKSMGPFNLDGKDVGPFSVKAKVDTEMDYDSNIFWTPNNKKADTINVTSPSILINIPLGLEQRHLIQVMYRADIGTFAKYSSQNYVNQYAGFNGNFILPFGYLDVQDNYDHTVDRAGTEFTGEVWHTDNVASADIGVKLNKLALETGYTDDLITYDDNDLYGIYDHIQDMVSETAYYQLFPKTKALIEYDHGWIDYTKDSDRSGDYDQVRAGLKGDITSKTEAIVKLGYQDRTYDNDVGFSGFVAEIGTVTQLAERTTLSLTYDQSAQESTYLNNDYYNMHYFYATLDQKLKGRFTLECTSGISRNFYPEVDPTLSQKRMDSILVEGVALKYNIKEWASAKIGYTYRDDISSIGSEAYVDNLWSIGFEVHF